MGGAFGRVAQASGPASRPAVSAVVPTQTKKPITPYRHDCRLALWRAILQAWRPAPRWRYDDGMKLRVLAGLVYTCVLGAATLPAPALDPPDAGHQAVAVFSGGCF